VLGQAAHLVGVLRQHFHRWHLHGLDASVCCCFDA
jgi:hypothetical protein